MIFGKQIVVYKLLSDDFNILNSFFFTNNPQVIWKIKLDHSHTISSCNCQENDETFYIQSLYSSFSFKFK